MGKPLKKVLARMRRKRKIRKVIRGTAERPRFCVFRSNRHVYVQVIDDVAGKTLADASTMAPEIRDDLKGKTKLEAAKRVGELAARRCLVKNIEKVVFDRNGYLYKGRVSALADSAREAGLSF